MDYKENPTIEDLADFLITRTRIRKLTEIECLRLMSFSEKSIKAISNTTVTQKLKSGKTKVKKMAKTHIYHMAGNSIDCNTFRNILRTLLIPNQPEYSK